MKRKFHPLGLALAICLVLAMAAHAQERPLSAIPNSGYIGLQSHTSRADFRNLRIKVL